jgi:hypothetical protein
MRLSIKPLLHLMILLFTSARPILDLSTTIQFKKISALLTFWQNMPMILNVKNLGWLAGRMILRMGLGLGLEGK